MGNAKRRGTFEQRKAAALSGSISFNEVITEPVDPDTFLYMFGVWCAAMEGQIPGVYPSQNEMHLHDDETGSASTARLTDQPITRAMMAVNAELITTGITETQGYMMRLSELGAVQKSGLFGEFLLADESSPGNTLISHALLKAMALAKFNFNFENEGAMGFDFNDLLTKAKAQASSEADDQSSD